MGKFNQTLFSYFGMLLLCLMVKMFELKELCFVVLWKAHLFEELWNRSRCDGNVG